MKLNESCIKYSGPPGTGKSTTLLNVVDTLLANGVEPENITFTTFTRAGAYEARDRACRRFNLSPQRFPYFRTLHSLCYQHCENAPVMTPADWCHIAKTIGVHFSLSFSPEEMIPRGHTKGDYLMSLWALARTTRTDLESAFAARDSYLVGQPEMTLEEALHFAETVVNYKRATGKIDFTDMLERFLTASPWPCTHIIVDEAQDLSALQWLCIAKMCAKAVASWVAGDDDQCIHEWNGADPKTFIALDSKEYIVLPQSYRIPKKVHDLAQTVIEQVQERLPKEYRPRKEEGMVEHLSDVTQVDLTKGTWLLLARNLIFLEQYASRCRELGIMFTGSLQTGLDAKVLAAIHSWLTLVGKQALTHEEALNMYRYMSQRDRVARGCKKQLQDSQKGTFTHDDLVRGFGLLAPIDLHWSNALDMIPEDLLSYLRAIDRHEGFAAKPRVEISTIHGAKGKEADNVLLSLDMTFRTWDAYQRAPASEHRVYYVGVTRARKNLYVLQPQTDKHYVL